MKFKKVMQKSLKNYLSEAEGKDVADSGTRFEKWCSQNLNIGLHGKKSGVDRHSNISVFSNTSGKFTSIEKILTEELDRNDINIGFATLLSFFDEAQISLFKTDGYWNDNNIINKSSRDILLNTENTSDIFDVLPANGSVKYKNKNGDEIEMKKTTGYPVFADKRRKGNLKVFMFSELKKIKNEEDFKDKLSRIGIKEKNFNEYAKIYNRNLERIKKRLNEQLEKLDVLIQRRISDKLLGKSWFVIFGDDAFEGKRALNRYNKENNKSFEEMPFIAVREIKTNPGKFIGKIKTNRFRIDSSQGINRLAIEYSHHAGEEKDFDESYEILNTQPFLEELKLDVNRKKMKAYAEWQNIKNSAIKVDTEAEKEPELVAASYDYKLIDKKINLITEEINENKKNN